jgi:hypothetical protein
MVGVAARRRCRRGAPEGWRNSRHAVKREMLATWKGFIAADPGAFDDEILNEICYRFSSY